MRYNAFLLPLLKYIISCFRKIITFKNILLREESPHICSNTVANQIRNCYHSIMNLYMTCALRYNFHILRAKNKVSRTRDGCIIKAHTSMTATDRWLMLSRLVELNSYWLKFSRLTVPLSCLYSREMSCNSRNLYEHSPFHWSTNCSFLCFYRSADHFIRLFGFWLKVVRHWQL